MNEIPEPRAGLRFAHARQVRQVPGVPVRDWPSEPCQVTAVRRGAVYFRNSTGFRSVVPLASWADTYGGPVNDEPSEAVR